MNEDSLTYGLLSDMLLIFQSFMTVDGLGERPIVGQTYLIDTQAWSWLASDAFAAFW